MALDLKPMRWDWAAVVTGDTFPAINVAADIRDSTLTRVRVKIKKAGESTAAIVLDSATSGIVINSGANWDFTIASFTAPDAGTYAYDLETTDDNNVIRTQFAGTWAVLSELTD